MFKRKLMKSKKLTPSMFTTRTTTFQRRKILKGSLISIDLAPIRMHFSLISILTTDKINKTQVKTETYGQVVSQ